MFDSNELDRMAEIVKDAVDVMKNCRERDRMDDLGRMLLEKALTAAREEARKA